MFVTYVFWRSLLDCTRILYRFLKTLKYFVVLIKSDVIDYKETKLKDTKAAKKVNSGTYTVGTPFHLELISISTYKSFVKILFSMVINLIYWVVVILIRHTFANILMFASNNCCMFDHHAKL